MRYCLECNSSINHKYKLAKFCTVKCKNHYWQINNWTKVLATAKRYRQSHKRSELAKNQIKEWHRINKDKVVQLNKAYHQRMKGNIEYLAKRRHHEALRRARKLQATPKWLSKEQIQTIKDIYFKCPIGYHVDHIVPLSSKEVNGLHVPWNLQYLPGIVNKIKSNKANI